MLVNRAGHTVGAALFATLISCGGNGPTGPHLEGTFRLTTIDGSGGPAWIVSGSGCQQRVWRSAAEVAFDQDGILTVLSYDDDPSPCVAGFNVESQRGIFTLKGDSVFASWAAGVKGAPPLTSHGALSADHQALTLIIPELGSKIFVFVFCASGACP